MTHTTDDKQQIYDDFSKQVNMTATQLGKWLQSDEAKSVGITKGTASDKKKSSGGKESTGHESGGTIVKILQKNKSDFTDADYDQMKRVNNYVQRHLAQKPSKENIEDSRWRYSLMNWGHDPLK